MISGLSVPSGSHLKRKTSMENIPEHAIRIDILLNPSNVPVAVDGELGFGKVDADRIVVPLVVAHLGQLPTPLCWPEGETIYSFETLTAPSIWLNHVSLIIT